MWLIWFYHFLCIEILKTEFKIKIIFIKLLIIIMTENIFIKFRLQKLWNWVQIDRDYDDTETKQLWKKLKQKIPEFFVGIEIRPSLLHGDLWSGNAGQVDGKPGKILIEIDFEGQLLTNENQTLLSPCTESLLRIKNKPRFWSISYFQKIKRLFHPNIFDFHFSRFRRGLVLRSPRVRPGHRRNVRWIRIRILFRLPQNHSETIGIRKKAPALSTLPLSQSLVCSFEMNSEHSDRQKYYLMFTIKLFVIS